MKSIERTRPLLQLEHSLYLYFLSLHDQYRVNRTLTKVYRTIESFISFCETPGSKPLDGNWLPRSRVPKVVSRADEST